MAWRRRDYILLGTFFAIFLLILVVYQASSTQGDMKLKLMMNPTTEEVNITTESIRDTHLMKKYVKYGVNVAARTPASMSASTAATTTGSTTGSARGSTTGSATGSTTGSTTASTTTSATGSTTASTTAKTSQTHKNESLILGYTNWFGTWADDLDFSNCKYKCRLTTDRSEFEQADIILMELKHLEEFKYTIPSALPHQYRALLAYESPAFTWNRFKPSYDGKVNITLTYRQGSTITYSTYRQILKKRTPHLPEVDYSAGKTKDMVAYVSNCNSVGYNRLQLMNDLHKQGLGLDLFGLCGKPNKQCPDHGRLGDCDKEYKFYLSFENSLCEDYITEKFWKVLSSEQFIIPVVMGGKLIDEYRRIAPPNSFIHVYNFTSVAELVNHLKAVASDSKLFNSYHRWREEYRLVPGGGLHRHLPACELCRIAHEKPQLLPRQDLHTWWNSACKNVNHVY